MEQREKKEELLKLLNVPAVAHFLFSQVGELKETFKDEIDSYNRLLGEEKKENELLEDTLFKKAHSYKFELFLEKSPIHGEHPVWKLKNFQLDEDSIIVRELFEELDRRLIKHKTAVGVIKQEIVVLKSGSVSRTFEISFMRSRDNRVVGAVKKIEQNVAEEQASSMLKIPTKNLGFAKPENELYQELYQAMRQNPEIRDEILFYYFVLKNQKKGSSKTKIDKS